MRNVVVDRPAVDAAGDVADGVIAFDGRWLGGETFAVRDRKAMKLPEA